MDKSGDLFPIKLLRHVFPVPPEGDLIFRDIHTLFNQLLAIDEIVIRFTYTYKQVYVI